jgi:glutamyl-tRNA synthetase
MHHEHLADLLFPDITKLPSDYEALYPERRLAPTALVTRLGPSPTGFIHLGNLYGALADERLAHQSDGVFFLRIEDTDSKREVAGAAEAIIEALDYFGIHFDEGVCQTGERGDYGPYRQSDRTDIYHCFARDLVRRGLAYPCFCSEEELADQRERQEAAGVNPGYYGEWALCRALSIEDIENRLAKRQPYVLRFRSPGSAEKNFTLIDGIRGELSLPENIQDIVLLKQNGVPTYHFAHVVDDHLMRTTHVIRGEEWLSSLPIHIQLFQALNWQPPVYCHTTVLMKMEDGVRRKLSKRKDPEMALSYYQSLGYHPAAVREYLMTILNSNYEEWRLANPELPLTDFAFTTDKMSASGMLFDIDKLNDVSKETLARLSDSALCDFLLDWAEQWQPERAGVLSADPAKLTRILGMDRHSEKPRKDLVYGEQILEHIDYFYDEWFGQRDAFPETVQEADRLAILEAYLTGYDQADDRTNWFDKIRDLAEANGFAAKPKDYKNNPDQYKGHVGDVSTVIRIALMGRSNSPDLWEIQQIMGEDMTKRRIYSTIQLLR